MFAFVVCLVVVAGAIAGVVRSLDVERIAGRRVEDQPATAPRRSRREPTRSAPRLRGAIGLAAVVTTVGAVIAAVVGAAAFLTDMALRHAAR
jgi:hypothetical protein